MVLRETLVDDNSKDQNNEFADDWEVEIGRWQITDWDDLLDGNVFFA